MVRVIGPETLSLSDSLVVSQLISLVLGHSLSLTHIFGPTSSWEALELPHRWHASDASAAIIVMLSSTVILCALAAASSLARKSWANHPHILLGVLASAVVAFGDRWFAAIRGYSSVGLLLWIVKATVVGGGIWRIGVALWWLLCLGIAALIVVSVLAEGDDKVSIAWRKFYHFLAVLMFAPAIILDFEVFRFASCAALCAMVAIEAARMLVGPGIAWLSAIGKFYSKFASEQDKGGAFFTHIFLLAGIAIPAWIHGIIPQGAHWLCPFSGIVSVGIGDSVASLVGSAIGTHPWPGTRKTVEGTLASIAFSLAFVCTLWPFSSTSSPFPIFDPAAIAAIAVSSLSEAFTPLIDNLVLPIQFYSMLCLFSA
jgi:dolichol kinase